MTTGNGSPLQASRAQGALTGLCIGDALAIPVHWYYDRRALFRDYGRVRDFLKPRNPHPDSILWRSRYTPSSRKDDILHDQAQYWGQRGIHYHQFLEPGENTLNVQLCRLLMESLHEKGCYDPKDYLERYIHFMTTPGMHRDTYIEECHRAFFQRYGRGIPPERCGTEEKHIGGLPGVVPLGVFYRNDPREAMDAALTHLALTHKGTLMEAAGRLVVELLLGALEGGHLGELILQAVSRRQSPFLTHPFRRWLDLADETVVGEILSSACYVDQSVPAVLYLAMKYAQRPEEGLIANTNLGGDNAYRGAVLGALLGAANGMEGFPRRWIDGLLFPPSSSIPSLFG